MPDRFEREIDEILAKIDNFPQGGRRRRNRTTLGERIGAMQRSLAVRLARTNVNQLMVAAFVLMVGSYLLRPLLEELWVWGLTLGLILFFTAFALSFRGGSSRSSEPYFRGRPRSFYSSNGPSLSQRLRLWWQQRNHRR